MPKYSNKFKSPDHYEETILTESGKVIGTIRVKPSSVLWRGANQRKFLAVSLDDFVTWITDSKTKAKTTKS